MMKSTIGNCCHLEAKMGRDSDDSSIKYIKRRSKLARLLRITPLTKSDKIALVSATLFFILCLLYNAFTEPTAPLPPPRAGGPNLQDAFPLNYYDQAAPHPQPTTPQKRLPTSTVDRLAYFQKGYEANVEHFVQSMSKTYNYLFDLLTEVNFQIVNNVRGGIRWAREDLLPPIPEAVGVDYIKDKQRHMDMLEVQRMMDQQVHKDGNFFWSLWKKSPLKDSFKWREHWEQLKIMGVPLGPPVDYTPKEKYRYPPKLMAPPENGGYPKLKPMKEAFDMWPQDEDYDGIFEEALIRFDYSNPVEREASKAFIEKELPFKLYNIPEVDAAGVKWTDDYLSEQFDNNPDPNNLLGVVQESVNNFFCFFNFWDIHTFGLPFVRNNDMTYREFSEHAKYADAARLPADMPHFYYQAGDYRHTRYTDENSFIGRDLPSFGSRNNTYFVFNVEEQAGIQCRMGERGVIAATHQDPGRNMIAMIHGAKRYILSPPNQCDKLGIFPQPVSPMHRHSIVNFGRMKYLDDPVASAGMPAKERAWLQRAAKAGVIDTVLKQGEVLYLPSHWFHYFISIERSTQCNCRSGVVKEGQPEFGGRQEVITCGQDWGIEDPLDAFEPKSHKK